MSHAGGLDERRQALAIEQAATWFAVLRGPDAECQRQHFQDWMNQSAVNRDAFAQVTAAFEGAAVLRHSSRDGHLSRVGERRSPDAVCGGRPVLRAALAAGIGLALVVGSFWTWRQPLREAVGPGSGAALASRHGMMRTVRLAQGATLEMDTASEVRFDVNEGKFVMTLTRGRVQLKLAKTAQAFAVRAGHSEIIARQAVFDVSWTDSGDPLVHLYDGQAQVRPFLRNAAYTVRSQALPKGRPVRLIRGAITVSDPGFIVNEQDWPSGWAQYRSVPLSELAQHANRYAQKPIVIDDPAVGQLRISGRFRFVDPSAVARNMARVFSLVVTERPDGLHIEQP